MFVVKNLRMRPRFARLIVHAGPYSTTPGALASAMWVRDRGLEAPSSRWHVEIDLDVRDTPADHAFDDRRDTHFHFGIYSEEWGYRFCHDGRASWIRVTDVPFVHVRDDFGLIDRTLSLATIGSLLQSVELANGIAFRRDLAAIRTDVSGAEPRIRRWLSRL